MGWARHLPETNPGAEAPFPSPIGRVSCLRTECLYLLSILLAVVTVDGIPSVFTCNRIAALMILVRLGHSLLPCLNVLLQTL